jgi:hypothetical protein
MTILENQRAECSMVFSEFAKLSYESHCISVCIFHVGHKMGAV